MSTLPALRDFENTRLVQKGDFLTHQSEGENNPSGSSMVIDVAKIVLAFTTFTVSSAPAQQPRVQEVKHESTQKVEVFGNILIDSQKIPLVLESNPSKPDIMVIDNQEGEAISMYKELQEQRNNFEKQSIVVGFSLASFCLILSLLTIIPWGASVPASVMFLSLSGFMFMRKRLREV